ncbi:30S ribosomal protein S1, partial [bacterium]|nr:30S ribosomal protein S1 [bacterium]
MAKERTNPKQFAQADTSWQKESFELSDLQIAELTELLDGGQTFKQGALIEGSIVSVSSDGVLIDVGFKSDGLVPSYEFSRHEVGEFKTGDKLEVIIDELESFEGNVILSYRKAKELKAWDEILELFESGKPCEGVVSHKVKGGLSVDIGIPAFLPGSQVDLQRVADFDQYVGQKITASVIKVNRKRGNVIISRRRYLNDLRAGVRKDTLLKLEVDQVMQGMVKNITRYGAFIDIGGVDGLLHITDMTWGRIGHPSELINIGDSVTVKVLSFDSENEKISLGLKQLTPDPWEALEKQVEIGGSIKGKITSITDYGLFVEVAPGVEGLVHISEISWTERIHDLNKLYNVGDTIDVLVVSLNRENRRMSLSVKQLDKDPWKDVEESLEVGTKIKGTISNITEFGIFVQIVPGIDGLVHISDLSWTQHIDHPGDRYKKSEEVEAIILDIKAAEKKVSLGIKQLQQNPWETIEDDYPVGTIIDGEVSKLTNFGVFVKVPSGIEGLVHVSEISVDGDPEKIAEQFKVGESR